MNNSEALITVENISKKFCRDLKRSLWYGIRDLAAEITARDGHQKELRKDEFWALEGINFEVNRGEVVGVIGRNGAGKTTLLRLINGLIKPDRGRIVIRGRVGALIALGAGFNPVLTGRENIYVNAAVLGLSKKRVDRILKDIIDFADIGDFIDTPVNYYSSGMQVRLGFSIAAHIEPDIMLIDEVLAVGDVRFQRKCLQKIKELQDRNVAIIFISHNMYLVQGVCSRAILLNNGKNLYSGDVSKTIKEYEIQNNFDSSSANKLFCQLMEYRTTGEAEILDVQLENSKAEKTDTFSVGESVFVKVSFFAKRRIFNPIFSIGIIRDDGLRCGLNRTKFSNIEIPFLDGKGQLLIEIEKIQLNSGEYLFEVAIADKSITNPYVIRKLDTFKIINPPMPNIGDSCGIFFPKVKWDVSRVVEKV